MFFKRLFATKSLETLHSEMLADEGRLRRALGPVALTSLGIGAIIGAGIFVMTGRVAADDAGPAIMMSYAIAGLGCALAAFCYAEFAALAPVAGSAYTYAYATLGELLAWIIGWDLVLEYAMSCATVASAWSEYFNKFTSDAFNWTVPDYLSNDPFTKAGAFCNLPAVLILLVVTAVLVIGIRESAASNTVLVLIKLGVVLFVIAIGVGYIYTPNWTQITPQERRLPEQTFIPEMVQEYVDKDEKLTGTKASDRSSDLQAQAIYDYIKSRVATIREELQQEGKLDEAAEKRLAARVNYARQKLLKVQGKEDGDDVKVTDPQAVATILERARKQADDPAVIVEKWGLLGELGFRDSLAPFQEKTRNNFMPYGLPGVMLGAALVFFAFIGFDSISTHAEEAIKPQRDVPIGILASLFICTVLYMAMSAIITGMKPYPDIDTKAAVSAAFSDLAEVEKSGPLKASAILISLGGLAGMTSVLLITFLSQARVFLAMSRDGFLPRGIFAAVHPKFKTPHISTMVTGGVIATVAAFTPIQVLEKMVNIGTLFAFIVVCAAVLILRIKRPDAKRPFRCPALFVVAPLGILINLSMMLFLPLSTWMRLVIWLGIGLLIYFGYGYANSTLGKKLAANP